MSNFYKKLLLVSSAVIFSLQSIASPDIKNTPQQKAPLAFIENKGQVRDQALNARPDIQFQLKAAGGLSIFIGNGAIHYQFSKADKEIVQPSKEDRMKPGFVPEQTTYTMDRMDVELVGANKNAQVIADQKQAYYENYFTDWSGGKYATVAAYNKITYKDIYPNIDWVLYTNNGTLEHEFIVHQGGKVSDIQLKYGGAKELNIKADGSLSTTTPQGTITEKAPDTYQKDGKKVSSAFLLTNNVLSYAIGDYNGDLIIDPTLGWATYYGGAGNDIGNSVATDGSGNVYITGYTNSTSGIATSGAYATTYVAGSSENAFLAKFNNSGVIQWATYYGGLGDDEGAGVATDGAGNVYMAGKTNSSTAIATSGAYQTTPGGGYDGFLVKFSSAGALQWGTYFGGSATDVVYSVSTDGSGNIYITGNAASSSGIATTGAYSTTLDGIDDAFLAKFNSSGVIQWATYFGGNNSDVGYNLATDASGNSYIAGATASTTGLATSGAYQTTYGGTEDAFLAKFNTSGILQWATYYGGSNLEYGMGAATDGSGYVYLTGYTHSTSAIATSGAYQTVFGGIEDGYLAKFDGSGAMQWATYYGGSLQDESYAVATDGAGNVYMAGSTYSTSAIATSGAYQTTFTGSNDAYFAEFNSAGVVQYATYFGGNAGTGSLGIALDPTGGIFITGLTTSSSGIATSGAYQTTLAGAPDVFLVKFGTCTPMPTAAAITGPTTLCPGSTITLSDATGSGTWSSGNTSIATVGTSGIVTGVAVGNAVISYAVSNSCGTANAVALVTVGQELISTVAGNGISGFSGNGGAATAAKINQPIYITTDASGNLYIADYENNDVRKVTTAGIISTIAGNEINGFNSDNIPATNAELNNPTDVAIDAAGNIYIADFGNNRVRKVDLTGIITTLAGGSTPGYTGDGGSATAAELNGPRSLAIDGSGNLYIGDVSNYVVRKVNLSSGIISTVAGNHTAGYSGDGLPATSAALGNVPAITVDAAGDIFIANNSFSTVREVNSSGIISTIAGNLTSGFAGDGGAAATATLNDPSDLAVDAAGNIYILDFGNSRIRRIDQNGIINTIIGNGSTAFNGNGIPATAAAISPVGVCVDNNYNIFISDISNKRIRKVSPAPSAISGSSYVVCQGSSINLTDAYSGGTWTSSNPSIASVGTSSGLVTGNTVGTATITYTNSFGCGVPFVTQTVTVNASSGVISGPTTVCPGNTITLTDASGGGTWSSASPSIATVGTSGVVTGVAAGNVVISYSVSGGCSASALAMINVGNEIINTIAGNGTAGFGGDNGIDTFSIMNTPEWMTTDSVGNIYFADWGNNRIRKITASTNIITTIAGTGASGYTGDGAAATAATLKNPHAVVMDKTGNFYIADDNLVIRKINTSGVISTYAGTGSSGYTGDGGLAVSAKMTNPFGLALNAAGDLFIVDGNNHAIRKVTFSTGIITTVAGTGTAGFTGDGIPATTSQLYYPEAVAIDNSGNLFIADKGNNRIRMVSASGTISTFAGGPTAGYAGDGGQATSAELNLPNGLVFDRAGDLFISDGGNHVIRMVTPANVINTIAGNGSSGYAGDKGPATGAMFIQPKGVAVDTSGNIYISDQNANVIRKVAPAGSSITGTSSLCQGVPVTFTDQTPGGTWTSSNPAVVTVGSATGYVNGVAAGTATITYNIATGCGSPYVTMAVTVSPTASVVAGPSTVCPGNTITLTDATGGGTWSSSNPAVATVTGGVVTGVGTGNTIISYTVTNSCGTTNGLAVIAVGTEQISTYAGTGFSGFGADGGSATSTAMTTPIHTAMDASGNIYYSDYTNNRVRKISTSGIVTTVAGNGTPGYSGDGTPATTAAIHNPAGIAIDASGNLFITDYLGYEIRKVNTSGIISTVAGTGAAGYGADGIAATSSAINHCWGVTTDATGNVYFSDRYNHVIRKVNTAGIISTIAGTGTLGYSGDGGPATAAKLDEPLDLLFDQSGNLLFTEGANNIVRKIAPDGTISTLAGNGTAGFGGDGSPATSATVEFNVPVGICLDAAGNIYISDYSNNRVRRISASTSIISTIAGTGAAGYNGDGIAPTTATLKNPQGVAIYGTNDLYICDANNYRIRKIDPVGATVAAITGASTVCQGATTPLADVTTGGVWSSSSPGVASVGTGGIVTGNSGGTANISYTVTYTCGTLYVIHPVTVNPSPAVPAAITGPTTICNGSTVTLNDVTSGGAWTSVTTTVATVPTGAGNVTGISLGTSVISYTISNSCGSNAATVNVTVVAAPGPITGTLSACVGSTSLLADGGGGVWTSSAPATASVAAGSGLVTGNAPGTATITYTLSGVCTATAIFTVNANPSAITPPGAVTMCVGGTASLGDLTSGGVWSSAAPGTATVGTSGIVTGVAAGTVNILYTTGLGCSATKSVTVLTTPAALSPASATVCVGSTATFTESVVGGAWSSVAPGTASIAGGVVTGVAAGTTSISYTIGTCAVGAPVTVNANPAAITPPGAVNICVGATASLGDVTAGGTWSSASPGTATVGTSGTVTGVAAGTTNILYTTGAGCSATKSITVLSTPTALAPASATVCTGNTVAFTETVAGGIWSSSNGAVASVSAGLVTGLTVGTTNISYTIGTCAAGAPVTVNLSPSAGVIVGPATLCTGSPVTYTDASPGGTWSSSNPGVATIGTSGLASGITPGTVTLSYAVTNGCGTATATQVVTVTSSASAGTIVGATTVCAGTFTILVDTTTGGTWSATNSNATITATGLLTGIIPGTDTIKYSVTNACGTVSATDVVTIGPLLSAGIISGLSFVCVGSSVTLTDATGAGIWSASNSSASVAGGIVTGVSAGVDTIMYTVSASCGSAVATQVVTVVPIPAAGTITGPVIVCAGSITTYTDAAPGGVWGITNADATISGAGIVTALTTGTDTITYIVTNLCGTAEAEAAVSIGAAISAGTISGPGAVCAGAAISLTDPASGGIWSTSNGHATIIAGTVTGVSAGTDTIYYTVTGSCGSVSASASIVVNPLPSAGTVTGPSTLCIGTPATYTDAAPGGTWSVSNSHAGITGGGLATPLTTGPDTVYYSVTNSCGTVSASETVTVMGALSAGTITGSGAVCTGTTITLTDGTPGGTWSASNGNATVSAGVVNGITAGVDTISYTVTGSCGSVSATKTVSVESAPAAGSITGPSNVCLGSPVTLTDVATGGAWSASNPTATVSTAGLVTAITPGTDTISYTVTNACGSAAATLAVEVSTSLPSAGFITGPSTVCAGSGITLADAVTGGLWNSTNASATVTGGTVTGVTPGPDTITYTVTNACGTAMASAPVTVGAALVTGTISGPAGVCIGSAITLTDTAPGGAWSSSNADATVSGGVVTGVSAGTSTISYTVSGSCGTASATWSVAVSNAPNAGSISGPAGVCAGSTITLTDATTGGTWSSSNTRATVGIGGAVTGVMTGLDTIRYSVTNGCGTAVASWPISVNGSPYAGSISGPSSICPGATVSLVHSASGGTWSSSNTGLATVSSAGVVTGIASGTVTISYTLSNSCGHSSATHPMTVLSSTACGGTNTMVGGPGTKNGAELTVIPNPNNGRFTMKLTSDINEPVHVVITNLTGQKVKEFNATTNTETEVEMSQAAGIYLLSAITSGGILVLKVIIN